jgi:hypothetical protein
VSESSKTLYVGLTSRDVPCCTAGHGRPWRAPFLAASRRPPPPPGRAGGSPNRLESPSVRPPKSDRVQHRFLPRLRAAKSLKSLALIALWPQAESSFDSIYHLANELEHCWCHSCRLIRGDARIVHLHRLWDDLFQATAILLADVITQGPVELRWTEPDLSRVVHLYETAIIALEYHASLFPRAPREPQRIREAQG